MPHLIQNSETHTPPPQTRWSQRWRNYAALIGRDPKLCMGSKSPIIPPYEVRLLKTECLLNPLIILTVELILIKQQRLPCSFTLTKNETTHF